MRRPHIRGAKPPNANIARVAPYGRGMPRPYAPVCQRTNSRPRTEQRGRVVTFIHTITQAKGAVNRAVVSNNGKLMIKKILFGLLAGLLSGNCALARERPNILLLMAEDMSPPAWRLWRFGSRYPKPGCPCGRGGKVPEYVYHRRGLRAEPGEPYPGHASDFHRRAAYAYLFGGRWRLFRRPPGRGQGVSRAIAGRYYTYTDHKLDYQFSGPLAGSGPFTIWDAEGKKHPGWGGRAQGQPFFGFLNFHATHESGVFRPLGTMPHSSTHFLTQVMRWWMMDETPAAVVNPAALLLPPYYPDTPVVRQDMARHYNNIAHMDREVAAILAQLEADGLADSTIVIWTPTTAMVCPGPSASFTTRG